MYAVVSWLFVSPGGGYYNPVLDFERNTHDPNRAALGMRWLVLVAIMFGAVISSFGGTNSHGIAAITETLHAAATPSDQSHELAHDDGDNGLATLSHGAAADHPHHGADHSHDKASALPAAWGSAAPSLPGWFGFVRPWIEMVRASRLERPPMG